MEQGTDMILWPEKIQFGKRYIKILDVSSGRYTIPYSEIVAACLSIFDRQSGMYYEPEITEITGMMEGDLILYDSAHRRWRIKTESTDRTAGIMIEELAVRAQHIWIGGGENPLNPEEKADFEQLRKMTELMRTCEKTATFV